MYLTIGETKLLVGQYGEGKDQETEKLELNFEYLFKSHSNYRRFAQVVFDIQKQKVKIKIKSEFTNAQDCLKLAQLLTGVEKLMNQQNLMLLSEILEPNSRITTQDFMNQQSNLIEYFC